MPSNDWNPSLYDQKHAFVSEYGKDLISLLEPKPGELILDVGCGTGHLARAIAEAGARVIGIDSSASMIETARKTYPGIEFLVADARDFSFPTPFDAVFSNATLHQGTRRLLDSAHQKWDRKCCSCSREGATILFSSCAR